jgi:hypothetical protein
MADVGLAQWIEPKWAREEHRTTLLSLFRRVVPRNWLAMTAIATVLCVPVVWFLSKTYGDGERFTHWIVPSIGIIWLFMLFVPSCLVMFGYLLWRLVPIRVRVDSNQLAYGSKTVPWNQFRLIRLDRGARPRLIVQDANGGEFWIGIAPQIDLDLLQRVCTTPGA